MSQGESKTSKRRLAARDKWRQALELRKTGMTFEAIAKAVGYSCAASAYKAVMTALKDSLREPAEELRELEGARLDALQERLADNVESGKDLLLVIDRLLKIMDRRAKLFGLDAEKANEVPPVVGPLVIIRTEKEVHSEGTAAGGGE